jgi:hypothetical protein
MAPTGAFIGGNGGGSWFGGGGMGAVSTIALPGKAYGSGGGGGLGAATGQGPGASGAPGVVIAEWFG